MLNQRCDLHPTRDISHRYDLFLVKTDHLNTENKL